MKLRRNRKWQFSK